MDLNYGGVQLSAGGLNFEATPSPYTLGWEGKAPLVQAGTLKALQELDADGKILLLHSELAKEQLMPKNFTFFNPEHHKLIYQTLESRRPAAIIAATRRNPELAGGMYPYPLIEDGDFDIPSLYMTDKEGQRLSQFSGQDVSLSFYAERIPSTGSNVYARKGHLKNCRVVVCAHIDAKDGTPGALDNASGIVVLLLLAEMLETYSGQKSIELIAINGEDYYGANGEVQLVEIYQGRFDQITLAVNIDGAGYRDGDTHYSLYDTSLEIDKTVHAAFRPIDSIKEGVQWYQSDHTVFVQNGCPAVAITSEKFQYLSTFITHTPQDRPELVDEEKLVFIARGLKDLVERLIQNHKINY